MISYSYRCTNCGQKRIDARNMADPEPEIRCSECNSIMGRDYRADSVNTGNKDYAEPLISHALAIHPDQIPEHRKHFPDIEVTRDGCPVLRSVTEHKKYLKALGWDKAPQRKKRIGKKLPCPVG